MLTYRNLLEEALESWTDARHGLIDEVLNVPGDRFDFRPTPEVRSVKELVVHILEVAMMMTGELTRADTNFHRLPWPRLLRLHAGAAYRARTKADLVRLLKSQFKEAEKKFLTAGELHMLQMIKRFDGERGTRLAWLYHGISHEEYHRGQLTVYERLMGIEPALTRKIRGG
ncbi:MAG: DinB family protein [candidate division NC10 bacterium]|nr:DinB family protein [candidate division NC10 bacterium]